MHEIIDLAMKINTTKLKTVCVDYSGVSNVLEIYVYDGEWEAEQDIETYKGVYFSNLSTVEEFKDIKSMLEQILEAKKVA